MRRLVDAYELLDHAGRDKLDSRELIMEMINNSRTIEPKEIVGIENEKYRKALQAKKEECMPHDYDSDWWYNRKIGIVDGLEMAFDIYMRMAKKGT